MTDPSACLKRLLKTQTRWATVRGPKALPCLWGSRQDAVANCDPDEYLIRVTVEAVNQKERKAK